MKWNFFVFFGLLEKNASKSKFSISITWVIKQQISNRAEFHFSTIHSKIKNYHLFLIYPKSHQDLHLLWCFLSKIPYIFQYYFKKILQVLDLTHIFHSEQILLIPGKFHYFHKKICFFCLITLFLKMMQWLVLDLGLLF